MQDGEFVTTSSKKDWVEKPKPVVQEATHRKNHEDDHLRQRPAYFQR
ncbi:hypothetical protein [Rhizobium laguerreae]|uniref:Uncharacterized protein n=1 Tax=Rhizobium laguerreae TaxID=1076926 RepID=A0ABR6GKD8_9HYPH|nr:hypothetical protein [Rhizobium laguerreae]MBB3166355.1 hypothetical protein [Rhizobium laguerreae]NNH85606.1 hypothetical protein [Rhizobium laguerreae]